MKFGGSKYSILYFIFISTLNFVLLYCKSNSDIKNGTTIELLVLNAVNHQDTQNTDSELTCETVSDPCMKICSQTVLAKLDPNTDYYGSGKSSYTTKQYELTLGSTNPIGQVYARQDHSYVTDSDLRPVTFNWFDSNEKLFSGREGNRLQTGNTQHSYAINTEEYTSGVNKYNASSQNKCIQLV